MQKKILFITFNGIDNEPFGGAKSTYRNYELLKRYAYVDVYVVRKTSNLDSIFSIIQGFYPPVNKKYYYDLMDKIHRNNYSAVFFDSSLFGRLVRDISNKNLKTIIYFHNCEADYTEVRFGKNGFIKKIIYKMSAIKNERIAARNASIKIVYSKRDAERIQKYYETKIDKIHPLSIDDIYEERTRRDIGPNCLLLGPSGMANVEGFKWFIENVSPFLHCKTMIVGKGFEKFRECWTCDYVEVKGFVEDVAQVYADACCVAIPLLSGGGMKIKTAEALMFGKYIFGTDEAFSGFEKIEYEKIGARCNNANEFIMKINELIDRSLEHYYNQYSRQLYIKSYSLESSNDFFKKLVNEI